MQIGSAKTRIYFRQIVLSISKKEIHINCSGKVEKMHKRLHEVKQTLVFE